VEAVKAGRSVYFASLADIISALAKAEREGQLRERIRFLCRTSLLIVDEIGYLPVIPGGGNLFFQLVNARQERAAMILTSNRGFAQWGEVFGDPVVATAPRSPASPRRRHPNRGIELSASPACRPYAGAGPRQGHHQLADPGTAAAPSRVPTQKWSS
jgi:DNA replication protein DnaC